jgi:four helix bundle protein
MDLTDRLYDLAILLPDTERYGLRTQIQRAAVSVPSNVAEGQGYGPGRRYAHHVRISLGSVGELGTLLEVAARRQYLRRDAVATADAELVRVRQLLHGLLRAIRRQQAETALGWLPLLIPPATLLYAVFDRTCLSLC